MSVGSVLIALQASRIDGRGVTTAEFLTPLTNLSNEVDNSQADGGPWTSGTAVNCVDMRRHVYSGSLPFGNATWWAMLLLT